MGEALKNLTPECGGFEPDKSDDGEGEKWHDICSANKSAGVQALECEGRHLFTVVEADSWRVFDARCPHHGTNLAYCKVHGMTVECPLHHWRFDLRNGNCIRFGTQDLKQLKTRIDGSRVLARW